MIHRPVPPGQPPSVRGCCLDGSRRWGGCPCSQASIQRLYCRPALRQVPGFQKSRVPVLCRVLTGRIESSELGRQHSSVSALREGGVPRSRGHQPGQAVTQLAVLPASVLPQAPSAWPLPFFLQTFAKRSPFQRGDPGHPIFTATPAAPSPHPLSNSLQY